MLAAGSLARGLRRRGASPASDSNARAIHAGTVPPGSRKPSDRPPGRRAPVRFGLESPLRYLFLSSLLTYGLSIEEKGNAVKGALPPVYEFVKAVEGTDGWLLA